MYFVGIININASPEEPVWYGRTNFWAKLQFFYLFFPKKNIYCITKFHNKINLKSELVKACFILAT